MEKHAGLIGTTAQDQGRQSRHGFSRRVGHVAGPFLSRPCVQFASDRLSIYKIRRRSPCQSREVDRKVAARPDDWQRDNRAVRVRCAVEVFDIEGKSKVQVLCSLARGSPVDSIASQAADGDRIAKGDGEYVTKSSRPTAIAEDDSVGSRRAVTPRPEELFAHITASDRRQPAVMPCGERAAVFVRVAARRARHHDDRIPATLPDRPHRMPVGSGRL